MSEPLWVPTPESLERAEMTRYRRRLEERTGRRFDSYDELWQWSIDDLDGFWASIWDHFGLDAVSSYRAVLADDRMPGAVWFPGARLNFAERCLTPGADGDTALVLVGESESGLEPPGRGDLRRAAPAGRRGRRDAAPARRPPRRPGRRLPAEHRRGDRRAARRSRPSVRCGRSRRRTSAPPACWPASTRPSRSCSSPPTATASAASRTTGARPWPSWSPACPRYGPCSPWTA